APKARVQRKAEGHAPAAASTGARVEAAPERPVPATAQPGPLYGLLARRSAAPAGDAPPPPGSGAEAPSAAVSPLPADVNRFFSSRLGGDFSDVRVHTGAGAVGKLADRGAHALTVGRSIYLRDGGPRPSTRLQLGVMAHELSHVRQQSQGPSDL